jgi:hypothetical protein
MHVYKGHAPQTPNRDRYAFKTNSKAQKTAGPNLAFGYLPLHNALYNRHNGSE